MSAATEDTSGRVRGLLLCSASAPPQAANGFAYDLARALDRYGLKDAGWSDTDIADAMELVKEPSGFSEATVKAILPMIEARITAKREEGMAVDADAILEAAAKAVENHQKAGREWIKGSLWDDLTREASGRIRALKSALAVREEAPAEAGEDERLKIGAAIGTFHMLDMLTHSDPIIAAGATMALADRIIALRTGAA